MTGITTVNTTPDLLHSYIRQIHLMAVVVSTYSFILSNNGKTKKKY